MDFSWNHRCRHFGKNIYELDGGDCFAVKGKNITFNNKARCITLLKTRNLNWGMIYSNVSLFLLVVATNLVL